MAYKTLILLGAVFIGISIIVMLVSDDFFSRYTKYKNKFGLGKLLLAIGLIIVGQTYCFKGILSIYHNIKVKDWHQVSATVIESSIVERQADQSVYSPRVVYQYIYKGHMYQSDRIKFGDFQNNDKNWIEEKLYHRFFVGNTIHVWINPDEPNEAVVDPVGDNEYDFLVILFGTFVSGIGASLILTGLRRPRD